MSGSSEGDAEGGEASAWVWACWRRAGTVMLGSIQTMALASRVPLDIGGAVTGGVAVAVEDLDAYHQRAKAAGAQIVQELTDDGYRRRCGDDLEGHPWGSATTARRTGIGRPVESRSHQQAVGTPGRRCPRSVDRPSTVRKQHGPATSRAERKPGRMHRRHEHQANRRTLWSTGP